MRSLFACALVFLIAVPTFADEYEPPKLVHYVVSPNVVLFQYDKDFTLLEHLGWQPPGFVGGKLEWRSPQMSWPGTYRDGFSPPPVHVESIHLVPSVDGTRLIEQWSEEFFDPVYDPTTLTIRLPGLKVGEPWALYTQNPPTRGIVQPVPEPSTVALGVTGLIAAAAVTIRRKRRQAAMSRS